MHTTYVAEAPTKDMTIICWLIVSSVLERWLWTNSGWSGWSASAMWRKFPPYGLTFQLRRNCARTSISSKKRCPRPHLYDPVSQLLGVNTSLYKRENLGGTLHNIPCGFSYVTAERTWEVGEKTYFIQSSTLAVRENNHQTGFLKEKHLFSLQWEMTLTEQKGWSYCWYSWRHCHRSKHCWSGLRGLWLQPGEGKWQLGFLDCVDLMAWHVKPPGVEGHQATESSSLSIFLGW